MMDNFLPPSPIKDSSNKWRNVLGALVIVFGVGTLLGWQFIRFYFERPELVQNFVNEISPTDNANTQTGGDLLIEPPEIARPKLPELIGEMLSPDSFTAGSMIVKDQKTGFVLYKKNEYLPRPLASITKLMSVLVILEKDIDWATSTQVIGADSLDVHMYAGDTYTLQELWDAALIGSSNKAIMSLVNALDWPEEAFIERMNQKAIELGMSNTTFVDSSGLGDENLSTASDIAILLEEALAHSKIRESLIKKELTLNSNERKESHHMWSTNWLLLGWINNDIVNLRGGKTGYTPAAGYNFGMQLADSAGQVISVVVLGTDSHVARFTEARDIAKRVFDSYRWPGE